MFKTNKSLLSVAVITATLGLTACGGSSSDPAPTPPVNSAPTNIELSASNIAENAMGADIGTLSATDANTADTFTFAVNDDRFEIAGATLKLKTENALDFEKETTVTLNITVTDSANAPFSKELTVTINDTLDFYGFESKSMPGESAVSYSGQIARQLLINDLAALIGNELGDAATFDQNGTFTTRDDVINALNSYFDVADYDVASQRPLLTQTAPTAQTTLADISGSSKNLVGKIAGNDATGQHKNWEGTELNAAGDPLDADGNLNIVNGDFAGWGAKGSTTPEMLVRSLFEQLTDNADTQLLGNVRQDPFGNDITNIALTEDGVDLKQLIQKVLLMAINFSQGVDDYLDNDIADKGLLSDHTDTDKAYTTLEHQFDEGFGYFGAARDYLAYSDDEVAAKDGRDDWQLYHDTNGDGAIDFNSEYNFGQSTNAAKRDRGATVATDFSQEAMMAFLQGRKLLNDTAGTALTDQQMTELVGYRDTAVQTWEKAIAATVVHYINDVDADLATIGTADFSFADAAKHWSELKGFALGLQFNRNSPLSETSFAEFHTLIGDQPVLTGDVATYRANLITARGILQTAYSFAEENVANW